MKDESKVSQKGQKGGKATKKPAEKNLPSKAEDKAVLVVSKEDDEPAFIQELEQAINKERLSVEERMNALTQERNNALSKIEQSHETESTKLQSKSEELRQMETLVHYYGSACKAFSMLTSENAKVEISISVTDGDNVQRLSSTKLETAEQILSLFRNNAEGRIKELVKISEKVGS